MIRKRVIFTKTDVDYSNKYFTIKPLADGTITFSKSGLSYSIDLNTWISLGTNALNVTKGTDVYLKGTMTPDSTTGIGTLSATANINVSGNIMSLLFEDDFLGQTSLSDKNYTFYKLFSNNGKIINSKNLILPATTLATGCYRMMFYGCSSLTTAPALPATTLAQDCYAFMFSGCHSLRIPPELPATTLADSCYNGMFLSCVFLLYAPELPATTLAAGCYSGMFHSTSVLPDCSNIDFTSQTVVASRGLQGLFSGTKVSSIDLFNILPINPSTGNYWLPVTTLAYMCYGSMFASCTSLTIAPELPATTLANYCYYGMFQGCSSLTTAPELPATTLTPSCYEIMFQGCTALNYIKCLATDISAYRCTYSWTNNIWTAGTFVKDVDMNDWVVGASSGIPTNWTVANDLSTKYFTIEPLANGTITFSKSGLSYSTDKLTWTLWDGSSLSVTQGTDVYLKGTMIPGTSGNDRGIGTLSASTNINVSGNPMSLLFGDNFKKQVSLSGKTHAFRYLFQNNTHIFNAQNLILPATILAQYCYASMFQGCTSLVKAPELPATILEGGCYLNMFYNCTSLTTAPLLVARVLTNSCYSNMFNGCSSLNYIKCLATDISASSCTSNWVNNVANLGIFIKNPNISSWTTGTNGIPLNWTAQIDYSLEYFTIEPLENGSITFSKNGLLYSTDKTNWSNLNTSTLSVTQGTNVYLKGPIGAITPSNVEGLEGIGTLSSTENINVSGNVMSLLCGDNFIEKYDLSGKNYAFLKLFGNNIKLINAKNLIIPNTTLSYACYKNMFNGCSALTTAPELPATTLTQYCYTGMFSNCTSLTTAPELPATTLTQYCYTGMFSNCSSLNYVKCLATNIFATQCTYYWVSGVASSGTFVKDDSMTSWTTGVNGIPTGWNVQVERKTIFTISQSDIGKIVGKNTYVYNSVAEATSDGTSAEAMIAYVGNVNGVCDHGLAISLENVYEYNCIYEQAIGSYIIPTWESNHRIQSAAWRLPSDMDWQMMMWGYYVPTSSATDINSFNTALGNVGTPLTANFAYWASDEVDTSNAKCAYYDGTYANIVNTAKTNYWGIRACLSF